MNSRSIRIRLLPLMGLIYYNSARVPQNDFQVDCHNFRLCWAVRTGCKLYSSIIRSHLWSRRGHLFERAAFEILKSIPHARAGDKTLRFDYAASQAVPPADKPLGAPLLFTV